VQRDRSLEADVMTAEDRHRIEGKIALSLAAVVVGVWSCILVYAWVRMSHLPPDFDFMDDVSRFYAFQIVFTIVGFLVLVLGLLLQRRLTIIHWSLLGLLLGGISRAIDFSVARIQSFSPDFYHVTFGHGVFNQCTSEWRLYSERSVMVFGFLAAALVFIPLLAHLSPWVGCLTKRGIQLPSARAPERR